MNAHGKNLVLIPEAAPEAKGLIIVETDPPPVGMIESAGDLTGIIDGHRVLYRKYAGTEVTVNGEARVIIDRDDVLAFLTLQDKVE